VVKSPVKTLSTRTHACQCGCVMDRDFNAARNILSRGLATVGHTGSFALNASNALGDESSTFAGAILHQQIPVRSRRGVSTTSVTGLAL
jgi:putative transposase